MLIEELSVFKLLRDWIFNVADIVSEGKVPLPEIRDNYSFF